MIQMTKDRREAYVEVLEILNHMEKQYVEKIPLKLREFFQENSSKEYKFHINLTIPLEENKLKENTLSILAMLNLNYWCENEEHKKELISKYNENEQKYQEKLRQKYNPDNLFKDKTQIPIQQSQTVQNNLAIVPVKESIFTKFIKKLKNIFHIH